ncbi:hypothetical protein A2943_02540 [Candidatus Adlerbacteria bacterium RIFCSPLOWO2_01_FULL_51_16]|uniref:PEGA domain-containing protein n=1 Tax=Candidatus Adlerbacteria bacterium RIFCSPLOWO2_01_FULL_51_16 TaxID=1797243 RepID=A0A1F4XGC1_9BACT|nr:MAG: hypothetical protein A2943_02540 [Candidatus Adlerbacteria bacterium RIFCSPLOWO2_01_FULL_51_16]
MSFLRYSVCVTVLAVGLFAAMPALASAATLYVDVNVVGSYNNNDRDPNDFTIEVDGEDVSPDSFKGTSSGKGKKVTLDEGDYTVRVKNTYGYSVSYSSGCRGDIDDNDTEYCTVTLRGSNYYNPGSCQYDDYCDSGCQNSYCNTQPCQGSCAPTYYQQPCQSSCAPTYYAQPVITKGYVPYFPNTGFEPVNQGALALAVVMLLAAGYFLYPHVRKAFIAVLS